MCKPLLDKDIILFDLDGTITDPKIGITKSVQFALKDFGINVDELDDLCKFIGPPLKDSFMKFYAFSEEEANYAIERYRTYYKDTGIYENTLYDGMEELLIDLVNKGKKLIVATSKPTVFAIRILEHFNIIEHFQYVCGSELDGTRSKKGEVIRYALDKLSLGITLDAYQETTANSIKDVDAAHDEMKNVVMIGDREHDIFGAKENGLASIGVLFGYGSYEELKEAGASVIVKTIEELANYLGL